jgi:2,3-bisphosphoglycerate-independent phosphoglycerate mutase
VDVPGATGSWDTDFEAKANAMLDMLKEKDFVCVHVRACHDAASRGNLKQKILSLEAMDFHILGAAKTFLESHKEARLLIAPLVNVPWKTKLPVRESVPFILAGKNVVSDGIEKFSEASARLSALRFKEGYRLMPFFLTGREEGAGPAAVGARAAGA